jgi:Ca2+/Na+ antiporter
MPDRAVIALVPAVAGGFILGLVVAIQEATTGTLGIVGALGALMAAVAGVVSVVRTPGVEHERRVVGALRAALAAGLFVLIYVGMVELLRDARLGIAVVLFLLGAACAAALARLRVREHEELHDAHPHAS